MKLKSKKHFLEEYFKFFTVDYITNEVLKRLIVSPGLLLKVFGSVLNILTVAVGGLGAISLFVGGIAGLAGGAGIAWLLGVPVPALPTHTPWLYALYAEILAALIGLLAGVMLAQKAAGLDPLEALRAE